MSKETADIYVRRRKVEPFTRDNSGDITEEFKASMFNHVVPRVLET